MKIDASNLQLGKELKKNGFDALLAKKRQHG